MQRMVLCLAMVVFMLLSGASSMNNEGLVSSSNSFVLSFPVIFVKNLIFFCFKNKGLGGFLLKTLV